MHDFLQIIDEMKIQEDLVYDKTGQRLHGFVNLGDINSDIQSLETAVPVAILLTVMVRGIFLNSNSRMQTSPHCVICMLISLVVHFCVQGVSGNSLYWIMWEAV